MNFLKSIFHQLCAAALPAVKFVWIWIGILGLHLSSLQGQTVCAKVKFTIEHEVTLERQAFEASLTVSNGLVDALEDFQVNVWVREGGSDQYLELNKVEDMDFFGKNDSTGNNEFTEIFFFNPQQPTVPVIVEGGGERVFKYLFIPTQNAALSTAGTKYEIGAEISYKFSSGSETELNVEPDTILVKPQPGLTLEYFLPKSVISDDPKTSVIETAQPFDLGLRVVNSGLGNAENLQIESFQPRLDENDLGLLIDLRILSSQVNNAAAEPSLTVNFGRVLAGHAETASWQMLSTLYGRFIDAKAGFTHSDELGGSLTSLIDEAKIYRLVGKVQANADNIPDLLSVGSGSTGGTVNGRAVANADDFALNLRSVDFLNLHPSGLQSDGNQVEPQIDNVINFSSHIDSVTAAANRLDVVLGSVPNQGETSYSFMRIDDPRKNRYAIQSVVRSDGRILSPANYWLSTEIREDAGGGIDGFEYFIDIFDTGAGGALNYKVYYGAAIAANQPPVIVPLPDLTLRVGDLVDLTFEAFDPDGDAVELALLTDKLPFNASFVDNGNNTATFTWPAATFGILPLSVSASDGVLAATDLVILNVVDPADGLSEWLESLNLTLDAVTLDSDSDDDGYSLLLEYILNLDPNEASVEGLPRVVVETINNEYYLVLECDVLNAVVDVGSAVSSQISLNVIASSDNSADPAVWPVLADSPKVSPSPIPGMTRLRWRDDTPLSNSPQGRFLRLRANFNDSQP